MEWQLIETAPMDGRPMLIWDGHWPSKVAYYCPDRECWRTTDGNLSVPAIFRPTHWMELPPSPKGDV